VNDLVSDRRAAAALGYRMVIVQTKGYAFVARHLG
jgi:hypothetical protein